MSEKAKEALLDEITSLKRRLAELERVEVEIRKLSNIVEQTDDSVLITDIKGVIEYVNPAFTKQTGFTREEAVGKTSRIVKSGRQDTRFYREQLWGPILRGEVFHGMLINRKKDGTLYYEEKTITPLKNKEGVITHFVSTGKDITSRKRMEAEMEQVRLAKERLEAVRTLSMTYAHNILNALTPVSSYAEMMVRATDQADSRSQWARLILHGTDEVVKIVGKLKEVETYHTMEIGGTTLLDLNQLKENRGEKRSS